VEWGDVDAVDVDVEVNEVVVEVGLGEGVEGVCVVGLQ